MVRCRIVVQHPWCTIFVPVSSFFVVARQAALLQVDLHVYCTVSIRWCCCIPMFLKTLVSFHRRNATSRPSFLLVQSRRQLLDIVFSLQLVVGGATAELVLTIPCGVISFIVSLSPARLLSFEPRNAISRAFFLASNVFRESLSHIRLALTLPCPPRRASSPR